VARVERAFDRVVGFVDLVGKVDSYISDRTKLAVRKLSAMYSEEERYKRGQWPDSSPVTLRRGGSINKKALYSTA